jgi:hypothetical protein
VADKDAAFLPTELFVGFLEHNQQRVFEGRALAILLLLPHPKIAAIIRAHRAKGFYDGWSAALIRYFAQLGLEPEVLNGVEGMEKEVDEFIKSLSESGRDATMDIYSRDHQVEKIREAVKCLGSSSEFKVAKQRLGALAVRVEAVKIRSK